MAIPSGLFTTSSYCCFGRYFLRMVLLYPIMSCLDAKAFARCMKELRLMVKGGSWLMFSWLNQSTSPSWVGWSVSRSRAGVFEWEWTWQFENENNNTMSLPYFWGEEVKYKGNRKHPDFSLVSHFLTGCAMTGWWLTSTIRCHKVAVTVYCFVKHRLWHQTCQYPRHLQNLGVCMCNSMV